METLLLNAGVADDVGDVERVVELLGEVVKLTPRNPAAWAWLGDAEARREQYSAAEEAFRTSIALDGCRAAARSGLAMVLQETSRHQEAECELERSIELEPTAGRYVLLAHSLRALGKQREAEEALRASLALDPENEEALVSLAQVLRDTRPTESLALLHRALAVAPSDHIVMRELSIALAKSGKPMEAVQVLERLIDGQPDDEWAHVYLGAALEDLGKLDLAEASFNRAATTAPLSVPVLLLLGFFLSRRGRTADAEDVFRRATCIDPSDPDAAYALAASVADTGRNAEAIPLLESVLLLRPSHEGALRMRRRLKAPYDP